MTTTTVVNFTIIFTCIFLSLLFIILLKSKHSLFITVFAVYMIGFSSWILAYLERNKSKLINNLTYSSLKYMSMFNILICVLLIAFNLYYSYSGSHSESPSKDYNKYSLYNKHNYKY